MDCINTGRIIAELRHKKGWTQHQLADMLRVSDKTVSKWETGNGLPETTLFPRLAELFGVTVDHLMKDTGMGIAVGGTVLLDTVKMVPKYPEKGMLCNIQSISRSAGGIVPNVLIDLSTMDKSVPLSAFGRLGDDSSGDYIIRELQKNGIDVSGIRIVNDDATSFSDVMTVTGTGERTFFTYGGACRSFCPEDVENARCSILHLGYILLLEAMDKEDPKYGTVMARALANAQRKGIRTSIDVVSNNTGKFAEKVVPALRYTDIATMNEIECCAVSGLAPRKENGRLDYDNLRKTMEMFIDYGVRETVIVHAPEAGFAMTADKRFYMSPALKQPAGYIKGTVGAGDAFCAGCLYGIYKGYDPEKMLQFAAAAAHCNLAAPDAVSGMKSRDEIWEIYRTAEKREL